MPTKRKKPPAPSLEQEAKTFVEKKVKEIPPVQSSEALIDSRHRQMLAAAVLPGLISRGGFMRAPELVDEAYRFADLILKQS